MQTRFQKGLITGVLLTYRRSQSGKNARKSVLQGVAEAFPTAKANGALKPVVGS